MMYVQVLINDIDLSSEGHDRYVFNHDRDLNNIRDSLKKIGLISPVVLKKNPGSDMTYTIVCGWQRVMVYRTLGWESIEARVDYLMNSSQKKRMIASLSTEGRLNR